MGIKAQQNVMDLGSVLKNPYFSKDREELFNYQLFYQIKKVGLLCNVDFELLEPIIDKNGYDVLIKYRRFSKPIQLKCAEKSAAQSWKINKKFFRPGDTREGNTILKEANADRAGLGGGVLLIEYFVDADNKVHVKYFYTDFVCLSFFQRSVRTWPLDTPYVDFIANIFDDTKSKVSLPKALFFEVTVEQFLFLARILPVSDDLTMEKGDSWFFHYPPTEDIVGKQKRHVSKDITVRVSDGRELKTKVELTEIFDFNLRNISINGKMII